MTLNYVTLILDGFDGGGSRLEQGTATFTPSVQLSDPVDQEWIPPAPVSARFREGLPSPQVSLLATDNGNVLPAGWGWKVSFINVPGSPAAFSFFLPFTGGATQRLSQLQPVQSVTALAAAAVPGVYVTPSGDATGVTDTALIQGLENLGAKTIYFGSGTIWTTGLIKQAGTIWQCAGRLQTIFKLANGANTDVIQGAGFSSLTLSGSSTGGIGGWGIRDCTIDGNKANQSGISYGIRVYGYEFDLTRVSIRNCLTDGLYTEWGNFGQPGPDSSMEAVYHSLEIHGNGGNGWHNRGPHDSRTYDVTIWGNGTGLVNYWPETNSGLATTVAAGSNGVNVSTFAGAGVLNVTSTLGYPAASISATQGALTVATSGGTATVTYTGTTATTFTGCTAITGSGTLSTGGAVSPAGGGYSANGCLSFGMHCYGAAASWQYQLDAQVHLTDCIGEVAATGVMLIRGAGCQVTGGQYFVVSSAPQTGCGIQLGDAANGAFSEYIRTWISNFACTSAATAGLNLANDTGQNDIDVGIFASSGSVFFGGSAGTSTSYKIRAYGQATTANQAGSVYRERSQAAFNVPASAGNAFLVTQNGADLFNFNTNPGTKQAQFPNGYVARWYTDNYVTPVLDIDATKAHIVPRSGASGSLVPAVANGTFCTGAAIGANSSDTAGILSATMVASPGAGTLITVTFKTAWSNHPVVVVSPVNAIAAQMQVFVSVGFGFFNLQTAVTPPAAVNSQAVSWNYIVLGQDG